MPFFQPIVSAKDMSVMSLEVLARWKRNETDFDRPETFLPAIKKMGLLCELDKQISAAALKSQLNWQKALRRYIPMSVNISFERLNDPGLPDQFQALGPRAKTISLELLETINLDNLAMESLEQIRELRDHGSTVVIDDFGTGKTSILALFALRPNRIKLDKRLVQPAFHSRACRDLVSSIVKIADNLNIAVTAEGIEDQQTAELMIELGCDRLQGFHFCRPLPADDVVQTLLNWPS